MSFKNKIAGKIGISLDKIPSGYQIIGDIFVLNFIGKKTTTKEKKAIGMVVLELYPYIRLVCESKGIDGELRKPNVKCIVVKGKNKSLITIHKENGILYKLDVSKIMFSKGNLSERQRLIKDVKDSETIVDMFAGIGYFSLGMAKFSKASKIYAIEKNPVSFRYLKENIKLNKLKNIVPILGDCRRVKKTIKTDRIIMGYFPRTQKFLPAAFGFLKERGVIHYHNIYKRNELPFKPLEELEKAANKAGFRLVGIVSPRIVKSYSPKVVHVVVDAGFAKN